MIGSIKKLLLCDIHKYKDIIKKIAEHWRYENNMWFTSCTKQNVILNFVTSTKLVCVYNFQKKRFTFRKMFTVSLLLLWKFFFVYCFKQFLCLTFPRKGFPLSFLVSFWFYKKIFPFYKIVFRFWFFCSTNSFSVFVFRFTKSVWCCHTCFSKLHKIFWTKPNCFLQSYIFREFVTIYIISYNIHREENKKCICWTD